MASAAQERAEESGAALIAAYDEQRSRADKAEAERDAALKRCVPLEAFITYIESPALKAWRGLDGEQRDIVLDLLRCAPQLWSYSGPTRSALGDAAAALEALALAERP